MQLAIVILILLGCGHIVRQRERLQEVGQLSLKIWIFSKITTLNFAHQVLLTTGGSNNTFQSFMSASKLLLQQVLLKSSEEHGLNLMEMCQMVNLWIDNFYMVNTFLKMNLERNQRFSFFRIPLDIVLNYLKLQKTQK